ncbi:cobalamin synthesis protein P47K [Thioalkalivibrio sp. K90mix]|uniref:CobW family GTP-binding protein n=1 Tax=Thioalkalivibrio sp. (strain K90mix) TaxID=396595 RepID=UPI000195AAD8|nr:GTP-binding protein [Thioalkalivibrio sp. K90mix]ADC71198.1 cobalamin synthesis protein P47K [Thioalkalivibrio sp. K90mix]
MTTHHDIPTHLVTGFLGVGKTTTIRQLLALRPEGEHWAVLVNEFGEIGVDGGLLADTGVALEEIPGGCLCCVSAQMFTVGLNRLIRSQHPDRILIEPTGLGHPAEIIRTLTQPPYDGVLDLRATITVMDARHLSSPRHREHPNWNDQIALADVLLANKADLYSEADREALQAFVAAMPPPRPLVIETTQGRVESAWLDRPRLERGGALFPEARAFLSTGDQHDHAHDHDHGHDHAPHEHADEPVTIDTRGDGYVGRSWLLPEAQALDHAALEALVSGFTGERLKGLVRTDQGWQRINRVDDDGGLEAMETPAAGTRPRIEAILPETDARALDTLDHALQQARTGPQHTTQ